MWSATRPLPAPRCAAPGRSSPSESAAAPPGTPLSQRALRSERINIFAAIASTSSIACRHSRLQPVARASAPPPRRSQSSSATGSSAACGYSPRAKRRNLRPATDKETFSETPGKRSVLIQHVRPRTQPCMQRNHHRLAQRDRSPGSSPAQTAAGSTHTPAAATAPGTPAACRRSSTTRCPCLPPPSAARIMLHVLARIPKPALRMPVQLVARKQRI